MRTGPGWEPSDAELIELAKGELESLRLARCHDCEDAVVVRVPKAYPVYDSDSARNVDAIKHYLEGFANLQLIGLNGLHRYNNQDHSMLTGLLAARNVLGAHYDLWSVNIDTDSLGWQLLAQNRVAMLIWRELGIHFGRD